jgi:hypothetical protein
MLPDLTKQDWIFRYTKAIFDEKNLKIINMEAHQAALEEHLDKFGSITTALRKFYSRLPDINYWKELKDKDRKIEDYIRTELAALDQP